VNFIVNYNLTATVASFTNTYLTRLKQLTLEQPHIFAISFFNEFNYPLAAELIRIFTKMAQPVNPQLCEIEKKVLAACPVSEIRKFTNQLVATVAIGNLKAFFNLTAKLPLVTFIPTTPDSALVSPSAVVETPPMEFSPDQATFDDGNTTFIFELLAQDKKVEAVKKVLEHFVENLSYSRFKMVIVASKQSMDELEFQLRQNFPRLPIKPFTSQSQFYHGVLLKDLAEVSHKTTEGERFLSESYSIST
jgi:hypothetical protein